jgi:hypothetical protein
MRGFLWLFGLGDLECYEKKIFEVKYFLVNFKILTIKFFIENSLISSQVNSITLQRYSHGLVRL